MKPCVRVVPAGSSTDVSEDWEKDFDLDMTEEEVQMALSKIESSGEVNVPLALRYFLEERRSLGVCVCLYSWKRTGRIGTERHFRQLCPMRLGLGRRTMQDVF